MARRMKPACCSSVMGMLGWGGGEPRTGRQLIEGRGGVGGAGKQAEPTAMCRMKWGRFPLLCLLWPINARSWRAQTCSVLAAPTPKLPAQSSLIDPNTPAACACRRPREPAAPTPASPTMVQVLTPSSIWGQLVSTAGLALALAGAGGAAACPRARAAAPSPARSLTSPTLRCRPASASWAALCAATFWRSASACSWRTRALPAQRRLWDCRSAARRQRQCDPAAVPAAAQQSA